MEQYFVLVNPNAGGGKARKRWNAIHKELLQQKLDFEFSISQSRTHTLELIHAALEKGYRKFIAVGGDGTFNSLVNGIFAQQKVSPTLCNIGLIPVGTGNDWIKTHHIPNSTVKAIRVIKNGKTKLHDVGIVVRKNATGTEERYFINVAGFGFQGFVAERIEIKNKSLKLGFAAFVLGILDALFRYSPTKVLVKMDDAAEEGKIFNVSAGICQYAGGGMKLTPNAVTDDGWLDITVARDMTKTDVLLNVPRLFSGAFVKHKKVFQYRTKGLAITSIPELPVEADGEVLGYGSAVVSIIPKAINTYVT